MNGQFLRGAAFYLVVAGVIGLGIFSERIFELFDRELPEVPNEWHGTYKLERDHPFWGDDYDFKPNELRIVIRDSNVTLLGKKHYIQKLTTPRFETKFPSIELHLADYHRLTLYLIDPDRLSVDVRMKTPSGPDRETWGIQESYKFDRRN